MSPISKVVREKKLACLRLRVPEEFAERLRSAFETLGVGPAHFRRSLLSDVIRVAESGEKPVLPAKIQIFMTQTKTWYVLLHDNRDELIPVYVEAPNGEPEQMATARTPSWDSFFGIRWPKSRLAISTSFS